VDGFEDVTDLLCGSDLKKASPKDFLDSILPLDKALVIWALKALIVCISVPPLLSISCLIYLSFTNFWQSYVHDHGVKITFYRLNIFYMNEAIAVILFALIYRLEGLSDSTFTS